MEVLIMEALKKHSFGNSFKSTDVAGGTHWTEQIDQLDRLQEMINDPLVGKDEKVMYLTYQSGNSRLRATIAENTLDGDLLDVAAQDDKIVRMAAAKNPYIRLSTLRKLTTDPWWGVRMIAISNPKATRDMILELRTDSNLTVCAHAEEMLKLTQTLK